MRVVAIADTHGDHEELGSLPEGDVLIHAGDTGWDGDLAEFRVFAEWFRSQPHAHKVFVAGNHDRCLVYSHDEAVALLGKEVFYLQDEGVTLEGLLFWGSPWQPEYDSGVFLLPRGPALASQWAQIPPNTDVLITHGPPRGFGDRANETTRVGCCDLLNAVHHIKPRLHLFGHVHQDGGTWLDQGVCFGNVTTWESCRGPSVFAVGERVIPVEIPPRYPA